MIAATFVAHVGGPTLQEWDVASYVAVVAVGDRRLTWRLKTGPRGAPHEAGHDAGTRASPATGDHSARPRGNAIGANPVAHLDLRGDAHRSPGPHRMAW